MSKRDSGYFALAAAMEEPSANLLLLKFTHILLNFYKYRLITHYAEATGARTGHTPCTGPF